MRSRPAPTPWSLPTKPAGTPRPNSRSRKTSQWCRCRRHVRSSMRPKTSGNTCARPISPTGCSRATTTFSMPARKPGKSCSTRPAESPPSPPESGQPSVNQYEGWYYFSASKMLGHLRSGPRGPYLDGFAAALERQGYSPATAVRYLRAAAHLGHVMAERGAGSDDIDLSGFSEHLRTCRCPRASGGRRNHHTVFGAKLFRQHLVEIGVCGTATVAT